MRADLFSQLPLSTTVRKTLNKIKDIKRDLDKNKNITTLKIQCTLTVIIHH